MKRNTAKYTVVGLAAGALTLSLALFGCGGGNGTPNQGVQSGAGLNVVCSNVANAARFKVDDFGAGFNPVEANSSGQVVGFKNVSGSTRTFVWKSGVFTDIGVNNATPVTINSSGEIAGNTLQGFVWLNGSTVLLKNLPGGAKNQVQDMNNKGEIVGTATTGQKDGSGADIYHAVYWANAQAVPQDLGVLKSGDAMSSATSINDQGQIVGYSGAISGKSEYVYIASHSSAMQDLGLLSGESGSWGAADLNTVFITNDGLIVGSTFLNAAGDAQEFTTRFGSTPTFDTSLFAPTKPNASDQFISITKAGGYTLYEPGKGSHDLVSQLPSNCSITLAGQIAIADGGHIVANGTLNGVNHGFLITP